MPALISLGHLYRYGFDSVKEDHIQAFDCYSRAAQQGSSEAQNHLGKLYERGIGTKIDLQKSIENYNKAALKGYAEAKYHLGYCYAYGQGVVQSVPESIKLFYQAAIGGYKEALYALQHRGYPTIEDARNHLLEFGMDIDSYKSIV